MAQFENALKGYLTKYKYPNETRLDVVKTLTQYKDLRPSLDPFVFNDGSQRNLIQLEGTIPVTYKGNKYNIPLSLWILDTHPYNPPMVYVRPTSTMQIKPSHHVDANGKVDIPVLREWRHPSSDLLTLVQILIFMFGEECPVFSKASGSRPAHQPLAYPGSTPYPPNPGGMPMPGMPPYPPVSNSAGPAGYPPAAGMGYPPYPPSGGAGYPGFGATPPYPAYPPTSQGMGPSGYPPYPPSAGSLNYPGSHPPGQPPYTATSGGYPPTSQFNSQQPAFSTANNVGTSAAPSTFTMGGTVTEADLRASLLSAVEDKMKRRLKETFAQAQAEMDVLTKTERDLNDGKHKLERIVSDLEKEKDDIGKNIHLLNEKDGEVKEAIQRMEGNEEVDIDKAVDTTTPLYRQLVDAFAKEQAIEDAIYYLGKALSESVIELELFLKKVRELSREQFMLRATIQKCREKAGLPPLV